MNRVPPSLSAASLDEDFARAEPLVRNVRTRLLPTGWSDWHDGLPPTEHKLDVDKQLDKLTAGWRKILSASEVRERYPTTSIKSWPSHQTALRFQLVWYAEVEFQDFITYLVEYLCLTQTDKEIRSVLAHVGAAEARASSQLREIRPSEGGKPAQGWKAWFVFRLAAFWYIITGEPPPESPDSVFAGLVSAGWNSLHPKIPEITWESFVRRFAKSPDLNLKEALETASIASLYAHRMWRP
jgi:hypothetical protein